MTSGHGKPFFWLIPLFFFFSFCVSLSVDSVGTLLFLVIVTLSSGVAVLCKGVLHPGAWEEESLFY